MLLFLALETPQHFGKGRAVIFQRLQGKTGAWEDIYQECSVQRSSELMTCCCH